MKVLIPILIGLLVVGCGEGNQTANTNEGSSTPAKPAKKKVEKEPPSKGDDKSSTTAKPVKELTLREKVIGTYELELKKFGETQRYVLLDNSTVEYYLNGKKEEAEHKWSIVDKEVHIERENRAVSVFSINKDESITGIATIDEDGKRKEILKEHQYTRKKIKSSTHAPPPERSLEVQFLDGELDGTDLEEVTKLDLDGYQLTEIPKNLKYLTQLKVLVLSKNQLTELPKGLERLTQLKVLNLYDNKLTNVKGLENLTKLEYLALEDNQLTDVPKELEKLTQLKELYLSDNPDLTKAQIDQLKKALPKCEIYSNAKK